MDKKTRNEQTRDSLNRLSADFEVELLRLIKTLNLISQSKELYKNQVDQIESISKSLQLKINDFTIKLLEIEKSVRLGQREQRNDFSTPEHSNDAEQYEILLNEINDFRDSISHVNKEIERAKVEHLSKLDSYYSVYNLELKASQGELDTKLSDLKDKIVNQPEPEPVTEPSPEPEASLEHTEPPPSVPDNEVTKANGSGRAPVQEPQPEPPPVHTAPEPPSEPASRVNDIPKRSINLSDENHIPAKKSSYSSNSVMIGIIFIFFLALVGGGSYYLIEHINGGQSESDLREDVYTQGVNDVKNENTTITEIKKEPVIEEPRPETDNTNAALVEEELKPERNIQEPDIIVVENKDASQSPIDEASSDEITKNDVISETPQQNDSIENLQDIAPSSEMYTVVGIGANVRSGPGINHEVSTVVLEGQQFSSLGEKRGIWIKVLTPDGTEGWISKKVVRRIN